MAAMDFDATEVPQDIVAVLSLASGTKYKAQNLGPTASLFVREQTAMPATSERAFKLEAGGHITIKPDGGPIWLWSDPGGAAVVLGEAA